jgi:hypothetical protein
MVTELENMALVDKTAKIQTKAKSFETDEELGQSLTTQDSLNSGPEIVL